MVQSDALQSQSGLFDSACVKSCLIALSLGLLAGAATAIGLGVVPGVTAALAPFVSSEAWMMIALTLRCIAAVAFVGFLADLLNDGSGLPRGNRSQIEVDWQRLQETPESYFFCLASHIEVGGLPRVRYVEIDGQSHGVDAGGLKRDFLSSLFSSLFDEERVCAPVSFERGRNGVFPLVAEDGDAEACQALGKLFFYIRTDADRPVIGPVFSDEVFDGLYTLLHCPQSEQIRRGSVPSWDRLDDDTLLTLFTQIDPGSKRPLITALQSPGALLEVEKVWLAHFVNPPNDESSVGQTEEGGQEPQRVEEQALSRQALAAACKDRLRDAYQHTAKNINAIFQIARGMLASGPIDVPTSRELERQIAGSIEVEDLLALGVLQFGALIGQLDFPINDWLSGWIRRSTAVERMRFLQAVTGSRSLSPGCTIKVYVSSLLARDSLPEFSTCARKITFPQERYTLPEGYIPPEGYQGREEEARFLDRLELAINHCVGFQRS